jgi:radical SAM superfamily enzyme YgiQ (UPF0313 family)
LRCATRTRRCTAIERCGELYGQVQRVFLGDGDAMALSTRRLMAVLQAIRTHMPGVRRISSYCLPRNVRNKSVADLTELREAGLSLAYVGAESGDDEVLQKVNKGETFESTRDALDKLGEAGITRSVMLLNGLGGKVSSATACGTRPGWPTPRSPSFWPRWW